MHEPAAATYIEAKLRLWNFEIKRNAVKCCELLKINEKMAV